MRSADEVQRAHDTLWPLYMGEVPLDLPREDRLALHAALDVLCWVLGAPGPEHNDHNRAFADNLRRIERELTRRGWALRERR